MSHDRVKINTNKDIKLLTTDLPDSTMWFVASIKHEPAQIELAKAFTDVHDTTCVLTNEELAKMNDEDLERYFIRNHLDVNSVITSGECVVIYEA